MATIKTGDWGIPLRALLTTDGGQPADILGGDVRVVMRRRPDGFVIDGPAENLQVEDDPSTNGQVEFTWREGDTDFANAGLYRVEWEVTYVGGEVETFPSGDWNYVGIVADNDQAAS